MVIIVVNDYFVLLFRTHKTFDESPSDLNSVYHPSDCMDIWALYVRKKAVLAKECISTRSRWMEEILPAIQDKSVMDIMIPGTHDSAAYSAPWYWSLALGVWKKFIITQDENIWNQLVFGNRNDFNHGSLTS